MPPWHVGSQPLREVQAHPRQEEAEALQQEGEEGPVRLRQLTPARAGARLRTEGWWRSFCGSRLASCSRALRSRSWPRRARASPRWRASASRAAPLRPIAWAGLIAVELALAVARCARLGCRRLRGGRADGAVRRAHRRRPASRPSRRAVRLLRASLHGSPGSGVLRNLVLAAGFALIPRSTRSRSAPRLARHRGGVALAACAGLAIAVLALAREVGMLRLQLGTQGALEIAGEGPEIGSMAESLASRLSTPKAGLHDRPGPRRLQLRGLPSLPDACAGDRERRQRPACRGGPLRRGR